MMDFDQAEAVRYLGTRIKCTHIHNNFKYHDSHLSPENGDIPWVSSKDMKTDVLYDSQIKINQLGVDNSTAKMVPINSVIMVIRSGILKHTLPVAVNAVPITVNQDLKVFIPSNRILSIFLMHQFKMLEKDILSGVRAVTADNIEFDSLKKREIIVPPMELQEQFAAFVEQTDKSKLAIQQSLDKLELLKKSLMQEYFQ
jgi:type I restriction enzyme S subunit